MRDTFVEYRRDIGATEPLHQGDVLEAVDPNSSKWQRHLLIITADCDLAHRKHQGRVTCIPLLAAEDYHIEMNLPRIRETLLKRPLAELQEIIIGGGGPHISEARLRDWVLEEDADTIISELGINNKLVPDARRLLECIQLIDDPVESLRDAIHSLADAQMLASDGPKSREKAIKALTARLQQSYSQPPGDALFISSFAPDHEQGYFAYLRHLEQIWEAEIAISPTRKQVKYRRVARLQDRFIHALVQRFGMVFMTIGLPSEYEEMRDLHADYIGELFQ